MITINLNKNIYTIDDEYQVKPTNNIIEDALIVASTEYDSPAQGFKTSFIAQKLELMGFDVVDVYDKEMEDAPEGIVY